MGFKVFKKIFILLLSTFFCLGYRSYPGIKGWSLDTSTTAGRKVFISFTPSGQTLQNNLPEDDVLGSSGATLTEAQLLQSVINDFNGIQSSNLILALDSDSDYAAYGKNHDIVIQTGTASGLSSGEAQPSFSGQTIIGCQINLTSKAYTDAKTYLGLLAHELGHCVGLDHPQETVWAVMSYFYSEDVYRLAIDDKMGIVHLYAKNSSDSQEKATFGLSCSQ